jgi:hypothetical protein
MRQQKPRNRPPRITRYGPGEEATPADYHVADFILTHSHNLFGRLIRFGETLRYWGDNAKYARWNHAALIASADGLTGCKFTFGVDGQVICSGLVARCLERTSIIFPGAAGNVSPADLAKQFGVTPPARSTPIGTPPRD